VSRLASFDNLRLLNDICNMISASSSNSGPKKLKIEDEDLFDFKADLDGDKAKRT
jgi:hypothetical protein